MPASTDTRGEKWADRIRRLAADRKAVILAHNYQPPEIQEIADLCGDSLELSIKAARTDAEVIVFCGVQFMAETASILSPDKTVLLPRREAGCPMADMVTPEALSVRLDELGPIPVVTYVNSSAAVKAMSTVCCTSANVIKVVDSIDADEILMVPDRNLAAYAASKTRKTIHTWNGYCPFHNALTPADVEMARLRHPNAVFMAHPECPMSVLELADVIASTSGMIDYAGKSNDCEFIVGTEVGLIHPLQKANPGKLFYPASEKMLCPDMKRISLEDVTASLENLTGEIKVPEEIRVRAIAAVERMLGV